MQGYYGSWWNRLGALFLMLIAIFLLLVPVGWFWGLLNNMAMQGEPTAAFITMMIAFVLCVWGMLALLVYAAPVLWDSFVSYGLEEEELVKLTPLGVQKLRWDSIEAVTDTGVYPWRRIVLWGVDGRRLTVNPEVVGSSEVFEVELIRRLQEVLRRQADRIRAEGIELHPVRSLALLWLLGSLTFFGVGLVFFVTHTSEFAAHGGANSQLSYPSVEVALFVGGFLSLLGALYSFMKTLHVDGQKLVLRGIWRSMEIPLEKVDSFYVYPFVHRYGTFEILRLHYSGKKFSYSSQRAGYLPLRSYLENVLPASVRQKGEQQAEKQISKELKTVTILSRIGAVLCVGMGIAGIVQANQKLALYHLLKSQGVGAPGVVNYRYTTGSRTTIYLTDYLFKVNGQTYEGASPLPMIPGLMLGRGCQYM
jgi:hypothetical protein